MLRTNYGKSDWYRLLWSTSLILIIPLTTFVLLVVYFVLPMIEIMVYFLNYMTESDGIKEYWLWIQESDYSGLESEWGFVFNFWFLITTLMGAPVVALWISTKIFNVLGWAGKKISSYHRIKPKMRLVVFWNDTPIQNTKWGRRFSK